MLILTIRTDNPQAEIGLYNGSDQLAYETWAAHRQLAETLHSKMTALLDQCGQTFNDIGAIIVFAGPGSFTGLRIGISVANALGYALSVPVVGSSTEDWLAAGQKMLSHAKTQKKTAVLPIYGSPVHITQQKK